jgi:hypothetical protein
MPNLVPIRVEPPDPVATWREPVAAALDFLFAFLISGYVVGCVIGKMPKDGFEPNGAPALVVFVTVALYFVICTRFLGGTVWQRALGLR